MTRPLLSILLPLFMLLAQGCVVSSSHAPIFSEQQEVQVLFVYGGDADQKHCDAALEMSRRAYLSENIVLVVGQRIQTALAPERSGSLIELTADKGWQSWAQLWQEHAHAADFMIVCLSGHSLIERLFASRHGIASKRYPIAWIRTGLSPAFTSKVLQHELGHLFGAGHSYAGVMSPFSESLAFTSAFSAASKREIRAGLKNLAGNHPVKVAWKSYDGLGFTSSR